MKPAHSVPTKKILTQHLAEMIWLLWHTVFCFFHNILHLLTPVIFPALGQILHIISFACIDSSRTLNLSLWWWVSRVNLTWGKLAGSLCCTLIMRFILSSSQFRWWRIVLFEATTIVGELLLITVGDLRVCSKICSGRRKIIRKFSPNFVKDSKDSYDRNVSMESCLY